MRALLMVVTLATAALGQERPTITAIVNSASYIPDIAYDSLVSIFGKNLADAEHSASTVPLPKRLGQTEVFICIESWGLMGGKINEGTYADRKACEPLELIYAGPTQINLKIPSYGLLGQYPREFAVRSSGMVPEKATRKLIYNSVPGIFLMGYDCGIDPRRPDTSPCGPSWTHYTPDQPMRGAITDALTGALVTSTNPAKIGKYYTIWATGLGTSPRSVSVTLSDIPVYGYSGPTWQSLKPSYVGPSPQFAGLYQINFQVPTELMGRSIESYPPQHPCGDYRLELTIAVGQYHSSVQLPVVVKNGDVPCWVRP